MSSRSVHWTRVMIPALQFIPSQGPTEEGRIKPNLAFVGSSVMSVQYNSGTGYTSMSGTSMATPGAAGVAALMYQANPELSPFDVRNIMQENCRVQTLSSCRGKRALPGNGRAAQPQATSKQCVWAWRSSSSSRGDGSRQPSLRLYRNGCSQSVHTEYGRQQDSRRPRAIQSPSRLKVLLKRCSGERGICETNGWI